MGHWPRNRLMALTRMTDLEGKREFRFPDLRDWPVLNTTGHRVGRVEEVFVDPNTLEPGLVLLRYRKPRQLFGRNTKDLLVPWSELRLGDRFVQTRWTEHDLLPATAAQLPGTEPATEFMPGVETRLVPHPAPEAFADEAVGEHEMRLAAASRPAWRSGAPAALEPEEE